MIKLKRIIIESIKRPFSNWKISPVAALFFIPIPYLRVLTQFISYGYILEVGKFSIQSKSGLPPFKGYLTLFAEGVKASIIVIMFFSPLIVMLMAGHFYSNSFFSLSDLGSLSKFLTVIIGSFQNLNTLGKGGVLFFLCCYFIAEFLYPVALLESKCSGNFWAAFRLRCVVSKAFSYGYILIWLLINVVPLLFLFGIIVQRGEPIFLEQPSWIPQYIFTACLLILIGIKDYFISVLTFSLYGGALSNGKRSDK